MGNYIPVVSCENFGSFLPSKNRIYTQDLICIQENVFQNHLLLECIVSHLPHSKLLQCREVNHLWKLVCTRVAVRRDQEVDILHLRYQYYKTFTSSSQQQKDKLLILINNLINNTSRIPSTKFYFDANILPIRQFEGEIEILNPILYMLYPILAEQVKELRISYASQELMTWATVKYSQLQVLNIDFFKADHLENLSLNREFIASIFEAAPCLHTLILYCGERDFWMEFCLQILIKLPYCSITTLHLSGAMKDKHLKILEKLNLQLESFFIEFKADSQFQPELLHNFLRSQRNRLLDLEICTTKCIPIPCEVFNIYHSSVNRDARMKTVTVSIPKMHKVRSVTFQNLRDVLKFPRLDFANAFPNLKKLSLLKFRTCSMQSCFENQSICKTVECLELPLHYNYGHTNSNSELTSVIEVMVKVFPNVKILHIPTDALFWVDKLCGLEYLEEVTLEGRDGETFLYDMAQEQNPFTPDLKSIEFLSKLKRLNLVGTDVGCFFYWYVVPFLRSLKILDLRDSPSQSIPSRYLKRMRDKFVVLC